MRRDRHGWRWAAQRPQILVVAAVLSGGAVGLAAAAPGDLDRSFAGDGTVTRSLSRGYDAAHAVTIARNGDVLVAAMVTRRRESAIAVLRLRPDGTFEDLFGNGGIAVVELARGSMGAADILEQPDGRIVVVGDAVLTPRGDEGFSVMRLLADGNRDASFGTDGLQLIPAAAVADPEDCIDANAVNVMGDGRIVVVGSVGCGGVDDNDQRLAVLRLQPTGALDQGFHRDGIWVSGLGCAAAGVTVRPDGGMLIAGTAGTPDFCTRGRMLLVSLHADGRLDDRFGQAGRQRLRFPGSTETGALAVALAPRRRLILAGYSDDRIAVARVDSNGRLDRTFGDRGRVTTRLARRSFNVATGVARAGDGAISVSALSYGRGPQGLPFRFGLIRVRASGRLDKTFSGDGIRVLRFGGRSSQAFDVAVDEHGRAVVAGYTQGRKTNEDVAVARVR